MSACNCGTCEAIRADRRSRWQPLNVKLIVHMCFVCGQAIRTRNPEAAEEWRSLHESCDAVGQVLTEPQEGASELPAPLSDGHTVHAEGSCDVDLGGPGSEGI